MPTEREKGIAVISLIVTLPSPPLPRLILQPRPINGTIQPIKEIVIAFERESFVSLELEKKKDFSDFH